MKVEIADDSKLDAQHECLETIVAQTHFVAIWGHTHPDMPNKIYSVDVWKLPEGFYCVNDAPLFERREKLNIGEKRYVDFGVHIGIEWHDSFESAMIVLTNMIALHKARIDDHA